MDPFLALSMLLPLQTHREILQGKAGDLRITSSLVKIRAPLS